MPLLPMRDLTSIDPLLAGEATAFVFKHSTRCPVSARADSEVNAFVAAHPDVPVHRVLVVEQRPVSLAIAERLAVAHASPQAILVKGGRAVWSASHLAVSADALAAAWSGSVE